MTSLTLGYQTAMNTGAWSIRAIATVALWHQRYRQRQALARLDDWQLRDIGISREAAVRESRKPFWKD